MPQLNDVIDPYCINEELSGDYKYLQVFLFL